MKKGYLFLGDNIYCSTKKLKINDRYTFKKASIYESKKINNYLQSHYHTDAVFSYEYSKIEENNGVATYTKLPKGEHNYWIVEYTGVQAEPNFETAMLLSSLGLLTITECLYGLTFNGGFISYKLRGEVFYSNKLLNKNIKVIDKSFKDELNNVYNLLNSFNVISTSYPNINRALHDFVKLYSIDFANPFRVLGFISLIENLLVSNSDSSGSITHQLKTKINLLARQYSFSDLHAQFYGDQIKLPNLIAKLYSYRSDIAHGNLLDFKNKLQLFTNSDNLNKFLESLTRKILIIAISNPELIQSLKEI